MPSPKPVTAIFDIGKTNKKFLLFDDNYAVVDKHQTELEQTADDDGDPCEDLKKLEAWIQDQFKNAKETYQIRTLNFSGYGASLVHLNKKGEPVTPLYNYLKDYPIDLLSEFYESVGGKEAFSLQTASPPMGMLNSGLQLYWLKNRKPELFSKIKTSLHFPNYLSYLFTGENVSELTSIGCHTALWDFEKMDYHQWVENENMKALLPSPQTVSNTAEIESGTDVGPGIHDSSAALAPYLIGMDEPFMLISTGTWSITLNPFNDEPLTYDELQRDCLCYLDIFGSQVKASRFFLGAEYAHQKKKIENTFEVSINDNETVLDRSLIHNLIQKSNNQIKIKLEQAYNSGPFPQDKRVWQINHFPSAKEAYHQLMLDLVAIQAESIKLAEGRRKIDKLIVTGGFSQNTLFGSLLASVFPDKGVYTSSLPDASALGAAMVLNENLVIASKAKQSPDESHDSDSGSSPPDNSRDRAKGIPDRGNDLVERLGLKLVEPIKELDIKNYSWPH